jgi:hypothetical protein
LLQETTGDKLTYVNDASVPTFSVFNLGHIIPTRQQLPKTCIHLLTSSIDCYLELVRLECVLIGVVKYRIVNGMQQDHLQVAYVVVNQALSTDGDIRKKGNKKLSNEEKQTRK